MKSLYHDEQATGNMSFLLPVFFIAIIISGVLFAGTTYGINEVIKIHNHNIEAGITSQQTADNISTAKDLNKLLGFIALIGIIVWTKNHSRLESTNTDAALLFSSIGGMFIAGFITIALILMGGMMLDTTTSVFNGNTGVDIADTSFGELSGTVDDTKKIAYASCYLPMFIGATLFLLNAVRKTTGVTPFQDEEFISAGID